MNEFQFTSEEVIGMNYDELIQETINCVGEHSYNPTAFKLFWITTLGRLTIQQVRAKCLVGKLFSRYRDVLPNEVSELVLIKLIESLKVKVTNSDYYDFHYEQLKVGLITVN